MSKPTSLRSRIEQEVSAITGARIKFNRNLAYLSLGKAAARVYVPEKPKKVDVPSAIGRVRRALGMMVEAEVGRMAA